MKPKVDIVLPCYNPQEGWADNIIDSFHKIQTFSAFWEASLIVVNDGSSKGISARDIELLHTHIPDFKWISYEQNMGKGFALRRGIQESTGDYVIYTDIDFPYTLESLTGMIDKLVRDTDAEVLAGERSNRYYRNSPFIRTAISKTLKGIVKILLHLPVRDTQCGLKGMKSSIRSVFFKTTINRYLFDIEFLWLASKNHKVLPYEVKLREEVIFSRINTNILFTEGWNLTKLFFRSIFH